MRIRVITLAYSEGLGGFPEQALHEALSGQAVQEVRDHFFMHGGRPHLALVITTADGVPGGMAPRWRQQGEDPGKDLPPERLNLHRSLRQWRNDVAKSQGIPSYLIVRNVQLAEICRRLPRTIEDLKAIEGVGEATCAKYGNDILRMIPADLPAAPANGDPAPGADPNP